MIPSLITEFYKDRIEDNQAYIHYLAQDIGEMNRIREGCQDWELEDVIRHIIFLENQIIEHLRKEIQLDRKAVREYEAGRAIQSPAGV